MNRIKMTKQKVKLKRQQNSSLSLAILHMAKVACSMHFVLDLSLAEGCSSVMRTWSTPHVHKDMGIDYHGDIFRTVSLPESVIGWKTVLGAPSS